MFFFHQTMSKLFLELLNQLSYTKLIFTWFKYFFTIKNINSTSIYNFYDKNINNNLGQQSKSSTKLWEMIFPCTVMASGKTIIFLMKSIMKVEPRTV